MDSITSTSQRARDDASASVRSRAPLPIGPPLTLVALWVALTLIGGAHAEDRPGATLLAQAPAQAPASAPGQQPVPQQATAAAPATPAPAPASAPPAAPVGAGSDGAPTGSSVVDPGLGALRAALDAARCHPSEVLELEGRWYAACGQGGVVVFASTPTGFALLDRRSALGDVRAVFERNGLVWVEVQRNEARPFSELGSASAAPPSALVPPLATAPQQREREPGDRAESIIAPPRVANSLSFEFALRPYLPIDELALAAVGQLGVTYRGERPWYVQGQLYPIGGLVGKGRERGLFGALASGGYDHPLFSVGFGVGVLRGTTQTWFEYVDGQARAPEHTLALTVTQSARLGALDGLHMAVTNAFVLEDDRWEFGFVDVLLQAPAGRRTWIVVDGGGGGYGRYFYGEVGLRRLVRGDRGHGSLFVRPSVGAAGVEGDTGGLTGGPMVGIHLELRR